MQLLNKIVILVKIGIILICCGIFMYWSGTAIIKFCDEPVSSTIRFQYGDDNHGKVSISFIYFEFPAQIC